MTRIGESFRAWQREISEDGFTLILFVSCLAVCFGVGILASLFVSPTVGVMVGSVLVTVAIVFLDFNGWLASLIGTGLGTMIVAYPRGTVGVLVLAFFFSKLRQHFVGEEESSPTN